MDKWDTLEDKVTEKKGSSKKVVVLCVVLGVIVASGGFFVGMLAVEPVIDEYLSDTKEISNLYDFYDLKVGKNQTAVYFMGASHVAESVYPPEINRILSESGYENISVYSVYVSSECPLDRIIHLQKLIDSKPSLVIYGVAASAISKNEITEDNILIVRDRLHLRDDSLYLYTDSERELFEGTANPFDEKRFLVSALVYKFIQKTPSYIIDYSVDPLGGENARKEIWDNNRNEKTLLLLKDENYKIEYPLSEDSRTVEALHYILNTLEEEGVPVVLLNAPINPLASDKITQNTRNTYFNILNETGYDWYDLEYSVSEEYFFDGTHTTFAGALQLAPIYADIIIQEVKSGAVHYA